MLTLVAQKLPATVIKKHGLETKPCGKCFGYQSLTSNTDNQKLPKCKSYGYVNITVALFTFMSLFIKNNIYKVMYRKLRVKNYSLRQ